MTTPIPVKGTGVAPGTVRDQVISPVSRLAVAFMSRPSARVSDLPGSSVSAVASVVSQKYLYNAIRSE